MLFFISQNGCTADRTRALGFAGRGLCACMCGSAVFCDVFFFIFFSRINRFFYFLVLIHFKIIACYPSVFLPILTTFLQISPEKSLKFVSVRQFTHSLFLPILITFCKISPEISFKSVSARLFTPSVFLPILTTFPQISPEIYSKFVSARLFTPSVFFANFRLILLRNRPILLQIYQIYLNVNQLSTEILLKSISVRQLPPSVFL
jgi:hypothetical protein